MHFVEALDFRCLILRSSALEQSTDENSSIIHIPLTRRLPSRCSVAARYSLTPTPFCDVSRFSVFVETELWKRCIAKRR